MIAGEKNAPSLATRGKSTFSEGGGDKGLVLNHLKKHDCSKFYRKNVAVQYFFKSFTMPFKLILKICRKNSPKWNAQLAGQAHQARAQAWVLWPKQAVAMC